MIHRKATKQTICLSNNKQIVRDKVFYWNKEGPRRAAGWRHVGFNRDCPQSS